ncbi:FG-GAP-like repeat-containing protein [Streptomyces sp. NBC_01460]|uniref:FG-GAP repeat protein n=1 Tax=Streptomyces sp. NBC_01460 TaxID=2903875 RepID=UPI002E312417|nr:FG-GAP repeat protein [Streptomyces sp. NBC_01460]
MRTNSVLTGRRWRAAALLVAGLIGGTLLPATPAAAVHGAVPGDFNGDGYRDAVLPAPGADVAGKEAAGAVVVMYGAQSGLSTTQRKIITQNTAGVPGTAEAYDRFGAATATADLNRDGYADLIVSSPYEGTDQGIDAGAVTVLWGSSAGLTTGTNLPTPESDPLYYGLDLAAVSAGPGVRTEVLAGGWHGTVRFSGPFSRTGSFGNAAMPADMSWGESVALGDFNGDGAQDHVNVTYRYGGLSGGLVFVNPENHVHKPGVSPGLQKGNGLISATGDLNGDGFADLVVGDPDEPEVAGVDGTLGGRILVWYGSALGIAADAAPVQVTQDTAGVPGGSEKYDAFGGALAVADLNRDGLADIVVGAPYEAIGTVGRAGQVTVVPGRRTGALGTGAYAFTQDTAGVPGGSEVDDFFGTTVAAGDVNKDGKAELFVGAASENNSTGAVWVLPGGTSGPTAAGSRMFTASSVGLTQQNGTLLGGNGLLWVI